MILRVIKQAVLILVIAVVAGAVRQALPKRVPWIGDWPTAETTAEEAYGRLVEPGDPRFMSLDEAARLHREGGAVFLDARARALYEAGRIPGARHLPFYEIETYQADALANVGAETLVVIYCEGIGCELSFFLGRELQAAGYENVSIFYGGFPAWVAAGLPVEREPGLPS